MAREIQIPTGISGVITSLTGVTFCMDGATHMIHSPTGGARLAGRNETVTKALTEIADGKTKVMVMGYPVWGAECMHVSVYHVGLVEDIAGVLGGSDFPWPFRKLI